MYGPFGRFQLSDTWGAGQKGKLVVCVGDRSSHGGTVITSNNDNTHLSMNGIVAVDQALHSCPIEGHGITPITAITVKSYHNDKLILTELAVAGCGARMTPPNRHHFVE